MPRNSEGQVVNAPGSVQGQNTGSGIDAQYGGTQTTVGRTSEGQLVDNDVEGQDNDDRPFPVTRPYPAQNAPAGNGTSGPTAK